MFQPDCKAVRNQVADDFHGRLRDLLSGLDFSFGFAFGATVLSLGLESTTFPMRQAVATRGCRRNL